MSSLAEFTDANFESEVLSSEKPVMVDFWAPWCQPCRRLAPLLDEIADENEGSAVIGKVNIDENPQVPQQYQISSIPAILVFKGGEVQERMVGLQPKSRLQEALDVAKGGA